MLVFIGLGLNRKGISLKGLEEARDADGVFIELYTSLIPELDIEELEEEIGKPIKALKRDDVEQNPDEILKSAKEGKAAFLVPGDPMIATTHVDLRLRAESIGIETRMIHGASIETAGVGQAGLQSYKFGKSATLPLPDKPSQTPYDVLEKNQELDLHTLFLLDIKSEEERYLRADTAIGYLLDLERILDRGVFKEDTLVVVVARAGSDNCLVKAGVAGNLRDIDFGSPPHVLIVPGKLHFLEAEALKKIADAPEEVVERNVK